MVSYPISKKSLVDTNLPELSATEYNDLIDSVTHPTFGHRHDGVDQAAGGTGRKVRAGDLDSLAADVDLGDYQIRVKQVYLDAISGTAPLIVDSSTKITNFNIDKVDGLDLPNTCANVLTDHNKAVHDALAINAGQVDGKDLPNTCANVLSDHNKAVHDALAINADTLDGSHKPTTASSHRREEPKTVYAPTALNTGTQHATQVLQVNWLYTTDTTLYNFWKD